MLERKRQEPLDMWLLRWTGTSTLDPPMLPLKDTGRIPQRLFAVLGGRRRRRTDYKLWEEWGVHEPYLDRVILDAAECARLAAIFPHLKPRYEALPLNVMRADVCQVLAVYFFGGLYRDLTVGWARPLKEWLSFDHHVVYGWADNDALFFAARPGDKCVWNVLQHITNIIAYTSHMDKDSDGFDDFADSLTGAGAWADAMQGCRMAVEYSSQQIAFGHTIHHYDSTRWDSKYHSYRSWLSPSWREARPSSAQRYFSIRANEHLMPTRFDMPVVTVSVAQQSSATFGDPFAFGPQNAFDGSLDTAVETQQQHAPYLDFTFARPMNIGTVVQPDSDHLTCVRVYNRHREPGTTSFAEGLSMELFDADGRMIHRVSKGRQVAFDFYLFRLAGMPNTVRRMRLYKNATAVLTFAEVQLYSDHLCRHARRVKVERYEPTSSAELPAVLTMATTLRGRCSSSRAVSPDPSFQYSFCLGNRTASSARDGGQRSVYMVANRTAAVIDGHFVRSMHANGYSVTVLAPTTPKVVQETPPTDAWGREASQPPLPQLENHTLQVKDWCAGTAAGTPCEPFKQFVAAVGKATQPAVLYVDMTADDWERAGVASLLDIAVRSRAELVFASLRLTPHSLRSPTVAQALSALLATHAVVAYHVDPSVSTFDVKGFTVPGELQLTLRLRTNEPERADVE
jgi:hypothetical protein